MSLLQQQPRRGGVTVRGRLPQPRRFPTQPPPEMRGLPAQVNPLSRGARMAYLANKAEAEPKEEEGGSGMFGRGLGFLVNNPLTSTLLKPLEVLDVPRRAIASGLQETVDVFQGEGFSMQDFYDQMNPLHAITGKGDATFGFGDIIEDTGMFGNNEWAKRIAGFIGDVGLDPLTYATFGVGAAAKAGTSAVGRASRMGKIADAVTDLRRTGNLTDDAVEELMKVGQRSYGQTTKLTRDALGMNRQGLRLELPFTGGRVSTGVVPGTEGVGRAVNKVTGSIRGGLNKSDRVQDFMRGRTPKELETTARALTQGNATPKEFIAAADAVTFNRLFRRYGGGFAEAGAREVDTAMHEVRKEMQQYPDRAAYLAATESVDGPETALNRLSKKMVTIAKDEFGIDLPTIEGVEYLPHMLSAEFKALLGEGGAAADEFVNQVGLRSQDAMRDSGFLSERALRPHADTGAPKKIRIRGRTIEIVDGTIDEINEKVAALFPELKGTALETDPQTLFERYVSGVAGDVGLRRARKEMGDEAVDALEAGADSNLYNVFSRPEDFLDQTATQVRRQPGGKRTADPFADDPFRKGVVDPEATTAVNENLAKWAEQHIEKNRPFADQTRRQVGMEAGALRDEVAAPLIQRNRDIRTRIGRIGNEIATAEEGARGATNAKRRARTLAKRTLTELNTEADGLTTEIRALRRSVKGKASDAVRQHVQTLNTRLNRLRDEATEINRVLAGEGSVAMRESLEELKQLRDEFHAKFGFIDEAVEEVRRAQPGLLDDPDWIRKLEEGHAARAPLPEGPKYPAGEPSPPEMVRPTEAPAPTAQVDPRVEELNRKTKQLDEGREAIAAHNQAKSRLATAEESMAGAVRRAPDGGHLYKTGMGDYRITPVEGQRGKYTVARPDGNEIEGVHVGLKSAGNAAEADWVEWQGALAKQEDSLYDAPTPTARRQANARANIDKFKKQVVDTRKAARKAERERPALQARVKELGSDVSADSQRAKMRVVPEPKPAGRTPEQTARVMSQQPVASNRGEFEAFLNRMGMTEAEWDELYPPPPTKAGRTRSMKKMDEVVAEAQESGGRHLRRDDDAAQHAFFATDSEFAGIEELERNIKAQRLAREGILTDVADDDELKALQRKAKSGRKVDRHIAETNVIEHRKKLRGEQGLEELEHSMQTNRDRLTGVQSDLHQSELSKQYRRLKAGVGAEMTLADVKGEPWLGVSMEDFLRKRQAQIINKGAGSAHRRGPQVQRSLTETQDELMASLHAGREGAPPSGAQRILDTVEAAGEAEIAPKAQRRAQLKQSAAEVPEDLQAEVDAQTQIGRSYRDTVSELQTDRAALEAEREQVRQALAAAPVGNKANTRIIRSEKVTDGVVESGLRPTTADLDLLDKGKPGLYRIQPLNSSLNDIEELVRLNPGLEDEVYNGVEARLADYRERLQQATKKDIKARQADQILQAAKQDDFVEVIKAKMRDEYKLMPENDVIVTQEFANMLQYLDEAKRSGQLGRLVTSYTSFFKTYATLSVGFHVRNGISATFMNAVDGVPANKQLRGIKFWKRYMDANGDAGRTEFLANLRKTDPKTHQAFEAVFGTGSGGRFFESGFAESTALKRTRAKEAVYRNWATRMSQRWGGNVEGSVRLGMAMDSVAKGATVEQAIDRITRIHFDYGQVSKFDEKAKKLIPFWTFMSRNLPMQITEMWTKPRGYAIYNDFVRNFSVDPAQFTPEYLLEEGGFDTGLTTPGGIPGMAAGMNVLALPDLAHNRVQSDIDQIQGMADLSDVGGLLSSFNPLFTAPIEYATGRNFFTQRVYEDDDYRPASGAIDAALRPLMELLNATEQGSGGTFYKEKTIDALRSLNPILDRSARLFPGQTGASGDPDRMLESYARWLGVPVRTVSEMQKRNEANRRRFDRRDERERERVLAGG